MILETFEVTFIYRAQCQVVMFRSVGGYHFLYADTFLSREEFEEMFDLTAYERVRKKYHAEGNRRFQ